jgi:hypothetical protein
MSETTDPAPAAQGHSNWQAFLVSMTVLIMFGGTVGWAIWTHDAAAQYLVPVLATMATSALGFYVGSSSSSKAKDAALAQAAKQ